MGERGASGSVSPPAPSLGAHVEALIAGHLARALRDVSLDASPDVVDTAVECILADVLEDGVPRTPAEARERWEPMLMDVGVALDDEGPDDADDESDDGARAGAHAALLAAVADAVRAGDEAKDAEDDLLAPGECEMCEREAPLTRHHLFPKSEWKRFERRRPPGCEERDLTECAMVCRPCHSAVHAFASERELGERFNTIEALLEQEPVAKFAAYQSKQRVFRKGGRDNRLKLAR